MASVYVMFEMGARWASPKKLLPVLVGGLTTAALRKPLDGINAVSASNESDVDDLLIDAAAQLSLRVEKPAIYQESLKKFSAIASETSGSDTPLGPAQSDTDTNELLRDESPFGS